MKPQIAFLGTGIMGAPMCINLLKAGYAVQVWNRTPKKTKSLSEAGAESCSNPESCVSGADLVILMLSSGPVIDAVLFTEDETGQSPVDHINDGGCLIVMSSIPVETSRKQSDYLAERGISYVDAPVSG